MRTCVGQASWLWTPTSVLTTFLLCFNFLGFSHIIFIGKAPQPPIYYNLLLVEMGKSRALEVTQLR